MSDFTSSSCQLGRRRQPFLGYFHQLTADFLSCTFNAVRVCFETVSIVWLLSIAHVPILLLFAGYDLALLLWCSVSVLETFMAWAL